ncbi:hypothetical protein [Pseudonocardia sp.]|uniref:hypothetical protein n=1 Tax=Pseudonocardia sp. TaxID=60912 RepID=UPI002610A5CD|nr:hypothetical protein [Pseudonocardia sp.]
MGAVRRRDTTQLTKARWERSPIPSPLWDARGGVAIDGFDYALLNDTRVIDGQMGLRWVEQGAVDYAPGHHDRLAAAHRRAGHEDLAERVLVARRPRRYAEAGVADRIWGALQHRPLGCGHQPWSAACW